MSNLQIVNKSRRDTQKQQLDTMLKYIKAEQRNSALLEKAGQDYYRDVIEPTDLTSKKTTAEQLEDLIGLKQLLTQDTYKILNDDEQVRIFLQLVGENVDEIRKIVSLMPQMIVELNKSNVSRRFFTGEAFYNYVNAYLERYDETHGLNFPAQQNLVADIADMAQDQRKEIYLNNLKADDARIQALIDAQGGRHIETIGRLEKIADMASAPRA